MLIVAVEFVPSSDNSIMPSFAHKRTFDIGPSETPSAITVTHAHLGYPSTTTTTPPHSNLIVAQSCTGFVHVQTTKIAVAKLPGSTSNTTAPARAARSLSAFVLAMCNYTYTRIAIAYEPVSTAAAGWLNTLCQLMCTSWTCTQTSASTPLLLRLYLCWEAS